MKEKQWIYFYKVLGFGLGFFFAIQVFAQTQLIQEDVTLNLKNYGPNRQHFLYLFASGGSFFGAEQSSLPNQAWISGEYQIGVAYKLKLTRYSSIGLTGGYCRQWFKIRQTEQKQFPDTSRYDDERFIVQSGQLGLFYRLNLDKRRGNRIGKYIDTGIHYRKAILIRHRTEFIDNQTGNLVVTDESRLNYVNTENFSWFTRMGWERYGLGVEYRFTDLLKKRFSDTDLLKWNAFVSISIF
ncbi:MAG: hypothetical protein NZ108_11020 [Bacteroidia bacterium]|nr:hypothetical protein [Bacteroidia bacterium]